MVAANVGGLRLVVDDGVTGYLVDERDPPAFAAPIERVLATTVTDRWAPARSARASGYRWSIAAARLRRHYARPRARGARAVQLTPTTQVDSTARTSSSRPTSRARSRAEPYVQLVEYDPELRRWYVRFTCDGRDATTIYFDLHQRTLRYEVYFLPMPPEHHVELYEFLLRAQPLDVRRALLARARRRRLPRRAASRSST